MAKSSPSVDLTQSLVEAARRNGLEVRTVVISQTSESEQVQKDISNYLEDLKKLRERLIFLLVEKVAIIAEELRR